MYIAMPLNLENVFKKYLKKWNTIVFNNKYKISTVFN